MSWQKISAGVVGTATVVGTLVSILTYCVPPTAQTAPLPPKAAALPPPKLRPVSLPTNLRWTNASGPQTFQLSSSAAVIEKGGWGDVLHVRFSLTNRSRVPVRAWVRAETYSRDEDVEAWTIDTGSIVCAAKPDGFNVIPVGDAEEDLVRQNDMGRVISRAPLLASEGRLSFSARFSCPKEVSRSAVLFATVRLTMAHKTQRRTVYFQASELPIYTEM